MMTELYAPFTRTGRAGDGDGLCQRRAEQVRRQRHAGDPHLVHERDRHGLREGTAPTSIRCGAASASDTRIGPSFLFPGVGYGGSCFPKDVKALLKFCADTGYDFEILDAVEDVNAQQKKKLLRKMKQARRST